jgi:polyisoprenoid-binding protein YceI
MKNLTVAALLLLASGAALAAPTAYKLDPEHSFPSFEADHFGGMSVWRGKFNNAAGEVHIDRAAHTGDIAVTIQAASINFGLEKLEKHVKSADFLDVEKFPTATFKGSFSKWNGDVPTEASGEFTLHGVAKPLVLKINSFNCRVHPMRKLDWCGADASASFNRADYGINWGADFGFTMGVKLAIQAEAFKVE